MMNFVLVPGEPDSRKNYNLPNIASLFPKKDIIRFTNILTKFIITLTAKINCIEAGNKSLFSLVQKQPDRLLQFYWVVLNSSDALPELDKNYHLWHFNGLKVHQCWESFSFNSDIFEEVIRWAAEKELPIFIHAYSHQGIHDLISIIGQNPTTKFIIGHLFGLEIFIQADCNFDNTYFEISPPALISEVRLRTALHQFGPSKLLFGSDIPYGINNQTITMERIQKLSLTSREKEMILGHNFEKLIQS
ncbi:amidohydrolase family protein [candidate division CSSED10-310 bacterium]|uniref:Amidohydrolase family protein n=1 Tax=candidate division CSSED10-310 bacterium TaxID=2855610 RepID=A0ABV6Z6K7_UNCC1